MTSLRKSDERRKEIWAKVYRQLIQHAIPDSRFHFDFLSFTPDFRGSSLAIDRLVDLPCYREAQTLLVTSDNSLEQLRYRALKDGKSLLVATYRMRRGFILLSPGRISADKYELAASLDGMEKPDAGEPLSLAQIRDKGISVDICVTGGLAFNQQGVVIWEGQALFEIQWALVWDIKAIKQGAAVVAIAHACQVVDESQLGVDAVVPDTSGEVQCDFVVTPDNVYKVNGAVKPETNINFETVDDEAMQNIPPLQELRGIRMMDKIMKDGGLRQKEELLEPAAPSADEQVGIDIVERLMKGYKT